MEPMRALVVALVLVTTNQYLLFAKKDRVTGLFSSSS